MNQPVTLMIPATLCPSPPPGQAPVEYYLEKIPASRTADLMARLNELGADGWVLATRRLTGPEYYWDCLFVRVKQ